ncbi:MAG: hypothetical protein CM15mP74_36160 [Halieaceae bacterium]|nr:MAG: hypothetical protein CM15mP74_36160 [Halieaceae bacterium]
MLRSMPLRRLKRGFKLGLIKLLIGNKAAGFTCPMSDGAQLLICVVALQILATPMCSWSPTRR